MVANSNSNISSAMACLTSVIFALQLFLFFFLNQVPQVFRGSLPQESQPQYLTAITITITKLTSRQGLDVSQRYFTDGVCHLFGLLTNVRIPAVSSSSVTLVLLWSKMSSSDVSVDFQLLCFCSQSKLLIFNLSRQSKV